MTDTTIWVVVATQQGYYDNILREPGEVFELLNDDNGFVPPATRYVPKLNADGKEIVGEGIEEAIEVDGDIQHRDFAPDMGDQLITSGPKKGEIHRNGWMRRVPPSTPLGQYSPEHSFGDTPNPAPRKTPTIERHHAQPRGKTARPKFG
jgi:hypothetical protein